MTITSCWLSALVLYTLVGWSLGSGLAEGTTMDDNVQQKIAEAAAEHHGWKVNDVRVDEVERLRRPSCSFYTAGDHSRPMSYQDNYAVVAGDQVVRTGDGKVVSKILDNCAAGAPAGWYAEIVTRFHRDLGGGIVLQDEDTRPDVLRKLTAAGKTFAPPALAAGKLPLTYLLLNPETYVLYCIQATLGAGGEVEVVKTKVQ